MLKIAINAECSITHFTITDQSEAYKLEGLLPGY